jgi:hypothetical protein
MRAILVILLILAMPAAAEGYRSALFNVEPRSITVSGDTLSVSITLENTTTGDYQLLLISASVMDNKGHTFELSGEPRGIHADVRDSCAAVGSIISAGARQVISIPFKAPQGTSVVDGTFALAFELQTPDRSQMFGCRTFAVSLDGIRP